MGQKVFFHVGLHKTASGALQRQFFPACTDLKLFTTQQDYTDNFVRAVTCSDPMYFDRQRTRDLLLPHMKSEGVNLISNESLSGPPYAGLVEYGLDHRRPVLENLQAAFPESQVLVVLRKQDSLSRSLYRQYLKRGGTTKIDRFYGMDRRGKPALINADRFRFGPFLDTLHTLFPAGLKILLFEEFAKDRDLFLEKLCSFLGVKRPEMNLKVENATRLGPVGMELSRWANYWFRSMINQGPLPAVPRKQFGRWRLVSPVEYLHDVWPGKTKGSPLASRVCNAILASVAEDNHAVDRRFNLGLGEYGYF